MLLRFNSASVASSRHSLPPTEINSGHAEISGRRENFPHVLPRNTNCSRFGDRNKIFRKSSGPIPVHEWHSKIFSISESIESQIEVEKATTWALKSVKYKATISSLVNPVKSRRDPIWQPQIINSL